MATKMEVARMIYECTRGVDDDVVIIEAMEEWYPSDRDTLTFIIHSLSEGIIDNVNTWGWKVYNVESYTDRSFPNINHPEYRGMLIVVVVEKEVRIRK